MAVRFNQSSQFAEIRSQIEQHLYDSVLEIEKNNEPALRSVSQFVEAIDRLMDTLTQMYQTPEPKDAAGEKSFPIREGRYRVYYKVLIDPNGDFVIIFLDIDDNKQSNLDRFPTHQQIEFEHDE